MKLKYFKDPNHSNFGDALNAWLWPKLLPDFLDDDEETVFLAIGSVLSRRQVDGTEYKPGQRKIVFGSGFVPSYNELPDLNDGSWDVFFVRGPHTAATLGLPPDKAIGDSAIAIRLLPDWGKRVSRQKIGFMPHWNTLDRGNWRKVCDLAGIELIDPRADVEFILNQILSSDIVICEAMHGAIVSDALRVPWVAATPIQRSHRGKWHDWADALDIKLESHALHPCSLEDLRASLPYKHPLRPVLKIINATALHKPLNEYCEKRAAKRLKALAKKKTTLSDKVKLDAATAKMAEQIQALLYKYGKNDPAHDRKIRAGSNTYR